MAHAERTLEVRFGGALLPRPSADRDCEDRESDLPPSERGVHADRAGREELQSVMTRREKK